MIRKEYRVVYEVPTANGFTDTHAIKADSVIGLKVLADKVREAKYKIVDYQERFKDDKDPYWKDEEWRSIERRAHK